MTREEALSKLHEYMRFMHGTISDKYYGEALRMAVSALQKEKLSLEQRSFSCGQDNDTIRRQ